MTSNCVNSLHLVINKAKGYINGHDRKNIYYFHSVKGVHIRSIFWPVFRKNSEFGHFSRSVHTDKDKD